MDTLRQSIPNWKPSHRAAFTLVELLVVITIIGILVALITVAALGALRTARQGAIKLEINQIAGSFDKYKDSAGSYPPNAQTDDATFTSPEPAGTMTPLDEWQVFQDMQRHLRQAFPKHKEPDNLIRQLVGDTSVTGALPGGMTAAEAVVFWLGGFSSDPQYPISGEGGPSYLGTTFDLDPIESRSWKYEFEITRLGPRDDNGYFNESANRFIVYNDPRDPTGNTKRRINFWQYTPGKSKLPVLYFDVSRHPAAVVNPSGNGVIGPFDPPASTAPGQELHVHALKARNQSADPNEPPATPLKVPPIRFANEGKFQILHSGVDDDWGSDILDKTSAHEIEESQGVAKTGYISAYLLFPTGPFTDAAADTIASFITQSRIEDAQQ
jgi:prepilin-type N-terminal cleavage/methylation domain-containing protein